jgi:methylthioribose-1-phosphate isomerase
MIAPLDWQGYKLRFLDQTRLPHDVFWVETQDYRAVALAIKALQIRGAPAIGVAAGYGIALGALAIQAESTAAFRQELETVFKTLAATRPTARNLFQVIERMKAVATGIEKVGGFKGKLVEEAVAIHREQMDADIQLSGFGAALIKPNSLILTHCNTGPLATAGYGTALGVIVKAWEEGKVERVFPTETRPLCQGARLTAWELKQAGVPFTLITDSMAGYVMATHKIAAVIVGADRIAANGDTANKIGTYTLAVLANEHGVPFYVAAPTTTIDLACKTGADIPIEERAPDEVACYAGVRIAPEGTCILNPSFDVTPARYISGIITERGVVMPAEVDGLLSAGS